MSIYKSAMGSNFYRLHPMLQKRYSFQEGVVFKASGIMQTIKGGPKWLYPIFRAGVRWKLLFPEHGKDIPFTISNNAYTTPNGESHVHWERIFYFRNKKRYFNALMSFDTSTFVIKDYLGEPPLLYSDLAFTVTEDRNLKITSLNQRLILGKLQLPLPKIFQGLATVTEKYDEELERYLIKVSVQNPLIGTVFSYEGWFAVNVDA